MSASVYANPYTYKPPPPRIDYPPLFDGFNRITLRYMLDSKFLAISLIVLGLASFVVVILNLLPFWFTLSLDPVDATFGSEPIVRGVSINAGLFYLRETEFDNMVFLDKYTNANSVPMPLQAAQVFSIAGTCLLLACLGAASILVCRRFGSVTALITLAGATTLAAILQVLTLLACAVLVLDNSCEPESSSCNYRENSEWMLPMYAQMYRVEPHVTPMVEANWAFYLSILGALLSIGAAALVWIEACLNCNNLRNIRYQQLKEFRDPYEKEADPHTGGRLVFQPPTHSGPGHFGMQPVIVPGEQYEGMMISPEPRGYLPQARFAPDSPVFDRKPPSPGFGRRSPSPGFDRRPPSPGFGRRHAPPSAPSDVSSVSDRPVKTREINL